MPVRIVRAAIERVRHPVTVAIARPARTLQMPSAVTFGPARLVEAIAPALPLVVALDPVMTLAAMVPVSNDVCP